MDSLTLLSKDKATLAELKSFMLKTLHKKLLNKALKKEDISGYAEANEIIKLAIDEIDKLTEVKKEVKRFNQSE